MVRIFNNLTCIFKTFYDVRISHSEKHSQFQFGLNIRNENDCRIYARASI